MHLYQKLASGPLDIIGDIHGEIDALSALLDVLGYRPDGQHPSGRKLVFVGDFCDRGPDSVAVIHQARRLIENGAAQAVLGNHEINLLVEDAKDGSGWYFDQRFESDQTYYAPFVRASAAERQEIHAFFNSLPLALAREDLRIVHAAWHADSIAAVRALPVGQVRSLHEAFTEKVRQEAMRDGLLDRYHAQLQRWKHELESEENPPPFLHAIADYDRLQQQHNPFKVLTSGVEVKTETAFFSGNRWRFSDRVAWWNTYAGQTPVLIGHYWRLFRPDPQQFVPRYSQLFAGMDSLAWHGQDRNVFCIDYSAGARWRDRRVGRDVRQRFHLAAMRWPERQIVFDTGERYAAMS